MSSYETCPLVAYILRQEGPVTASDMFPLAHPESPCTESLRGSVRKRLLRRAARGLISARMRDGVMYFAEPMFLWDKFYPCPRAPKPASNCVGDIVPPRQIDIMNSPVYLPEPFSYARPGAEDAMRIKSFGFGC